MEKPKVDPAVGMRLRIKTDTGKYSYWEDVEGQECTLIEKMDTGYRPYRLRFDDGRTMDSGSMLWNIATLVAGPSEPLGAPSVQGGVTAWEVGQRRRGKIRDPWGNTIGNQEYVVSHRCYEGVETWWVRAAGKPENSQAIERACESWPSELLGPLPVLSTAPTPEKPFHETILLEMAGTEDNARMARVGNLSALQLIQSRKPPEPYICPVDDWDLLPDAGT